MALITKPMCNSRKTRVILGSGEAWYYVCRSSVDVFVTTEKGRAATAAVQLTRKQMEKAIAIMDEAKKH
jgi:hypothetical protein